MDSDTERTRTIPLGMQDYFVLLIDRYIQLHLTKECTWDTAPAFDTCMPPGESICQIGV